MEQTRLEKIAAMVKKMPVEAVLITSPVNRQYATTFPSSAGACLVTEQGDGYFFTDFRYIGSGGESGGAPRVSGADGDRRGLYDPSGRFAEKAPGKDPGI